MSYKTPQRLHGGILSFLLLFAMTSAKLLEFDKFTASQLKDVITLKDLVKNERNLEKYMTEDYNLAKYLAISNFDVVAAHALFQETVNWRASYNMSSILFEDWTDMRQRFPYSRGTFDKTGKPIVYMSLAEWDVAGFLNDGDSSSNVQRFIRYFAMFAEESEVNIHELRGMGRDVTQTNILTNLSGFGTLKHACIQCLYAYRDTSNTIRPHYPYIVGKNVVFNTPLMFKMVYSFLPEQTQKNMELYGQDRKQWEPMLLNLMTPDQFPKGLLEESNPDQKDNVVGILQWRKEL